MKMTPPNEPSAPAERWPRDEQIARTFLLALSHDLRNPVSVLSGVTQLLKARAEPSDEERELLDMLSQAVTSIRHVIADLLDTERLADPELEVVRRPTDIGELVARCVDEAAVRSHVVTSLPAAPIHVDAGLVERIIVNLLMNADRYSSPDGAIVVRVCSGSGRVMITVDDDGPGMGPLEKQHVFDLFAHGPDGGLGIGLYVVKRFAALHGGGGHVLDSPTGGARLQVWLRE